MKDKNILSGFSRLNREDKLNYLLSLLNDPDRGRLILESYRHGNPDIQKLHDQFSENTVTNHYLPWGIAPNFMINGKFYMVPMVTEESSVVAAASKSAKFWASNGGFQSSVSELIKNGQVHFIWKGDPFKLIYNFPALKERLYRETPHITANMVKRGGGIRNISLVDKRDIIEGYFQISADFDTRDSMGANFINSCLEEFAVILKDFFRTNKELASEDEPVSVIMSILSNYTDNCIVTVNAGCETDRLAAISGSYSPDEFATRFNLAVKMANADVRRATTHNKGIFNGIDAVVIATGNDFRAVEAAGHAWASGSGQYLSLSDVKLENGYFSISLSMPLSVGTVGGLTSLHPLSGISLEILGNPDAEELMGIIASAGLASNFAAVSSLITSGIQSGHMKMHIVNILSHLGASEEEKERALAFFRERKISFASVERFLSDLRGKQI